MMFAERFARDGCLVIDKLFDPALIDSIFEEYHRQYGDIDPANRPLHLKAGDRRLQLPITLRGALLDPGLYGHPLLLKILGEIFGSLFLIDNVTVVTALAGADHQPFHRDQPDLFPLGREYDASLPCYAVIVAIPLIDLDEQTGTTQIFPGTMGDSHEDPDALGEGVMPFTKRGGCYLLDYRVQHRGFANRSDRDRPVLYITYSREWFTDTINYRKHARLEVDPAEFETIPLEHRPLFRRAAGKGLLDATIEDLRANPYGMAPKID
jgi:hypothetical protein